MKSTLLVLVNLAATLAAVAQPASTALGILPAGTPVTASRSLSAGEVYWYRFTIPGPVGAGSWLDVVTNGPAFVDTYIGLYDDAGSPIATDNNDGPPAGLGFSLLTFGDVDPGALTRQPAPAGSDAPFNGRDGQTLAPGQYWLAITGAAHGMNLWATEWRVTAPHTQSGVVETWIAYGEAPPACDPVVNCDGVPDQDDVACMILAVAGDTSCFCQADPDFNGDGVPDQGDVADVILTVAGAPCP